MVGLNSTNSGGLRDDDQSSWSFSSARRREGKFDLGFATQLSLTTVSFGDHLRSTVTRLLADCASHIRLFTDVNNLGLTS
ncbi:unnamed protein product [Soboliphyme baturini]|uniref:Uncharacterized protein n=1 Tax=Soboliphyme baturini TaxID=241478 RepID=A0A183IJM3_9BILA|nr:unnamed protein product [Soboliphyme baturini]